MANRGKKVRGGPPSALHDARGNLADRVKFVPRLKRWGIAAGLGVISSAIFAPLGFSWFAWFCLTPILVYAIKDTKPRGLFGMGYCWGLGHYIFCLAWLKEVFLPAPVGAAIVCAFYPATWLYLCGWMYWNLLWLPERDLEEQCSDEKPSAPNLSLPRELLAAFAMAAIWVALEWIRSWVFTGFPWNQLGIALWRWRPVLPLCRYTGVYGLSFLIVFANGGLFVWWKSRMHEGVRPTWRKAVPSGVVVAVLLSLAILAIPTPTLEKNPTILRIGCIQGNIPQIRNQSRRDNQRLAIVAAKTYADHTRSLALQKPDLIVWPETALPWPLFNTHPQRKGELISVDEQTYSRLKQEAASQDELVAARAREGLEYVRSYDMQRLVNETKTAMILGTLDIQGKPGEDPPKAEFNSAVQIDATGKRVAAYDKIHTVPFGEYLPMADYWPKFLREMDIFMRSITPGKEHTIFHVGPARIGLNICYEDVFPEVSAGSVKQGSNLLLTITNDAWYRETSGSLQHTTHALFRAVETFRPMLRNGNNSDTCLIMPDGRIVDQLVDPKTGSPFYRGSKIYNVPVYENLPTTFYTRHGNLFAYLMTVLAGLTVAWCIYRTFHRRRRILDAFTVIPENEVPVTEADQT